MNQSFKLFCPIVFDIDSRSLSACTVLYYHLFMTACLTCLYFLAYFLIVSYICSMFHTPLISLAVASLVHFPCFTPLLVLQVLLHVTCQLSCFVPHFLIALCHISDIMLLHMHLATSHVSCHFSCFTSFLMLCATRVSHVSLHFSCFLSLQHASCHFSCFT